MRQLVLHQYTALHTDFNAAIQITTSAKGISEWDRTSAGSTFPAGRDPNLRIKRALDFNTDENFGPPIGFVRKIKPSGGLSRTRAHSTFEPKLAVKTGPVNT